MNTLQVLTDQLSADPFNRALTSAYMDFVQEFCGRNWFESARLALTIKRVGTDRLLVPIVRDSLAETHPWSFNLRMALRDAVGIDGASHLLVLVGGRRRPPGLRSTRLPIRNWSDMAPKAYVPARLVASLALHRHIPLAAPRWMYLLTARGLSRPDLWRLDEDSLARLLHQQPSR